MSETSTHDTPSEYSPCKASHVVKAVEVRQVSIPCSRICHQGSARTIRSSVHWGFSTSGWMLTQLSSAMPKFEPPQTKTVSGSVYGACCGNSTAVA